jgi:predicted MFS family arabinose efflux permease
MQPGMIGVTFIVSGVAGMVASPLGGRMFDRAAARKPHLMVQLLLNNLASLIGEDSRK